MKLQKPWPSNKSINKGSYYGPRKNPVTGQLKKHRGVDVGGTFPVTAAGDGVVTKVAFNGNKRTGGGHVVIIKHADRLHTVYYHGAHATALKVGDRVKAGDFIYTSGTTGASTGNHLHFEVRTGAGGAWGTDVDPVPYLEGLPGTPPAPAPNGVSGKLDKATWKQWQTALKDYGYAGVIDGIPGPMTYKAMQKWAGVEQDGIIGPNTRKAVQKKLKVTADGKWGKITISALQRLLNTGKI